MQSEYPKYTPLLAKILDGLISSGADDDKIGHKKEVVSVSACLYLNLLFSDISNSVLT